MDTGVGASLTIGEVAGRTGVATSALRFYEARGLIAPARTAAGHCRYARAALRRVAFIAFAQRIGLTLAEIRVELDRLPADRVPTSADWDLLTQTWADRIDARIAEMERLKVGLTGCIGCGCLSLERCAVLNPGDALARQGPGPRYWLGDQEPGPPPPDAGEADRSG